MIELISLITPSTVQALDFLLAYVIMSCLAVVGLILFFVSGAHRWPGGDGEYVTLDTLLGD